MQTPATAASTVVLAPGLPDVTTAPDHTAPIFDVTRARSPLLRLQTLRTLAKGRIPGQVVLQYTDRCNASCVQCGMRASNPMSRATMDPDAVRRSIDAMAAQGVQALSFTGGEPLLCLDEIAPLMRYAGAAGIPFIRTGTNGYVFRGAERPDFTARMERLAATLAETPLNTFWISLDSAVPELHERNRGFPGIVAGIQKALPIFHSHGLYPSANLGLNRHTGGAGGEALPVIGPDCDPGAFRAAVRRALDRFYTCTAELGFTIVNACYPMSLDASEAESDAVYAATSQDHFIRFSPMERLELFRALHETVPKHRARLRIFTPRSALLGLMRQYQGQGGYTPCRGGIDFFFIDAKDMNTYPCGYRGTESLGKFWDLDLENLHQEPHCTRCDWECFRDPSEFMAPFTELLRRPAPLLQRLWRDAELRRAWWEDLRYYRACNYFNARTAPDYGRLAAFAC